MIFDHRTRFALWCLGLALLLVLAVMQGRRGWSLDTHLFSLLPPTEQEPVVERALRTFGEHVSGRLAFLIGHSDEKAAFKAADFFARRLTEADFTEVVGLIDEDTEKTLFELYFPFRYQLLSAENRALLVRPQGGRRLTAKAEETLYSPMSGLVSRLLDDDPLLLLPDFLRSMARMPGALKLREGWLGAERDGTHWFLITANSRYDPFSRRGQQRVNALIEANAAAMSLRVPGARLQSTGVILYAAAATRQAEREVSTIGSGSLLGVALLFLGIFRSARPMGWGLLPIAVGLLTAATVSFAIFDKVHLLTLGFGASLIGVCIDYTFHYLCERETEPGPGKATLAAILPAVTLGALTSIMGYLGLAAAPFPGLRQMAVFSIAGLAGAYVTVVCCFPMLVRYPPGRAKSALAWAERYLSFWERTARPSFLWVAGSLLAVVLAMGLWQLRANDDIRLLQRPSMELLEQEQTIREVAGDLDHSRFLLVEGATPQEVLEREEALATQLAHWVAEGSLTYYQGISSLLPSEKRQRRDHALLRAALLGVDNPLARYFADMGFDPSVAAATRQALLDEPESILELESWLAHPASRALRHLWLGATSRGYASLTVLGGITNPSLLEDLENGTEGVHYIDKVADYTRLMQSYRRLAARLVVFSYLVIALFLIFRYGWRRGLWVTAPPVGASLLTLAIFGWLGWQVTLFNLLALLLVLGIGIDYTIFYAESGKRRAATTLAIQLSACTTILSFGLLALSHTPVLQSFGLTVLIGITLALIAAPLAGKRNPV